MFDGSFGIKSLSIGVSQIQNNLDVSVNLSSVLNALKVFHVAGADLVLFPECALTGFSSLVKNTNYNLVQDAVVQIREHVDKLGLAAIVPTAWLLDGAFYNCGFYFQPGIAPVQFFKEDLTESETKFFIPQVNSLRSFEVNGVKLGILICIEAALDPWKYYSKETLPDVLLWPGYWGNKVTTWDANNAKDSYKVFKNMLSWKRPLIQATFSKNHANVELGEGPFGRSFVVTSDNRAKFSAAYREEDNFLVRLEGSDKLEVTNVSSV